MLWENGCAIESMVDTCRTIVLLEKVLFDMAADLCKFICPQTCVIRCKGCARVLQSIYANAGKPQGGHLCRCASLLKCLPEACIWATCRCAHYLSAPPFSLLCPSVLTADSMYLPCGPHNVLVSPRCHDQTAKLTILLYLSSVHNAKGVPAWQARSRNRKVITLPLAITLIFVTGQVK